MTNKPADALLIFIKNAVKGNVKTRLAASVGEAEALQIYQKLLNYTRGVAQQVEADRQLWYSRYIDEEDDWSTQKFEKKLQEGSSLGRRMRDAFEQAFEAGRERVVIIGSDCATVESRHINEAFKALQSKDVVLGPSKDGGYYLLGMRSFFSDLFEDKAWSTESVFAQTLADCRHHRLSYHLLEELNDVDTKEDWAEVRHHFH